MSMAYSLNNKIIRYLESKGIDGATIHEGTITISDFTRTINGVVSKQKLDAVIADYNARK